MLFYNSRFDVSSIKREWRRQEAAGGRRPAGANLKVLVRLPDVCYILKSLPVTEKKNRLVTVEPLEADSFHGDVSMGLLSRSASFVRYAAEGDLPENFWEFAATRIKRQSFRDIDDSFEERSVGWVSVSNMFDSDFAYASYAAGDYVVLALRIDERKVSSKVLNKFCMKEEERVRKMKQVPKLNRAHRMEIKENVALSLMKKALPVPAVYDMCWNLAEGTVLFFSTNQKAQEAFEEFFRETFGLPLILQVPYLAAEHLLKPEAREALADLQPAIFV